MPRPQTLLFFVQLALPPRIVLHPPLPDMGCGVVEMGARRPNELLVRALQRSVDTPDTRTVA
jgi:hypothetical protein